MIYCNSVSKTALVVAKNLIFFHREYPQIDLLDPATVQWTELLLNELNQGNLLNREWYRRLFRILEKLSIHGLAFHHAIRKKIILELIPLMIWISCLLICVLNLESIFKDDYEDGTLDMFIVNERNIEIRD